MATVINHSHSAGAAIKALAPDPSCQPCPDCGGLECLCRPRFFAGQLLSEQDLNRLDHYMVEKHKLHNRHLHGSGVVCGLEVKCAPCTSGHVTVTPGYALSPCGEDIVVCRQDSVDICALIKRCRTDRDIDCAPYAGGVGCEDAIEEWILAVRYAEAPTRGVTALTGAGQGCGCSCGSGCSSGSCGCSGGGGGCGCGGGATCSCGAAIGLAEIEPLRTPRPNRGAPPSCEPTVTCETYRYDVFRAPEEKRETPKDDSKGGFAKLFAQLDGDMMARIACCIEQLEAVIPPTPGDIQGIAAADRQQWYQWACRTRSAIANYLIASGGQHCDALARLQAIVIPLPSQPIASFQGAMIAAWIEFLELIVQAMIECICSNTLPPCPPAGDPRVPLALVRVRKRDCTVVSICNWTPLRHHVLTFPTLRYWYGFMPIWTTLREWIHGLCCQAASFDTGTQKLGMAMEQPHEQPAGTAAAPIAMANYDATMNFGGRYTEHSASGMTDAFLMRESSSSAMFTAGDFAAALEARNAVPLVDSGLIGAKRAKAVDRAAQSPHLGVLSAIFSGAAPMLRGFGAEPSGDVAALKAVVAQQSKELAALRVSVDRLGKAKPRKQPNK
jgi:hypothetical protein